ALVAALGLVVWRWSSLPSLVKVPAPDPARAVARAAMYMGVGLTIGLLLLAVIRLAIQPSVPEIGMRMTAAGELPISRRLTIIFLGAVGEELIFRLLILSVVAGLTARLLQTPGNVPASAAVLTAIAVSALLFGAAHLPSWGGGSLGAGLALSVVLL